MAEYFLFFSLCSLFFLLLAEPLTLRVTLGGESIIGVHLSLFALLLFPGRKMTEKEKAAKPKKKKQQNQKKKKRNIKASLALARAGLSALSHFSDRPTVRIFTLAPGDEDAPDKAALSHGRHAVLASALSLALCGFFPRTVTDPDVLSQREGTRLDVSFSVCVLDLFLMAWYTLRTWLKSAQSERKRAWKI